MNDNELIQQFTNVIGESRTNADLASPLGSEITDDRLYSNILSTADNETSRITNEIKELPSNLSSVLKDMNTNELNALIQDGGSDSFKNSLMKNIGDVFSKSKLTESINKINNYKDKQNIDNSIKSNNDLIQSQIQLLAAEDYMYKIIKKKCPKFVNNKICINFKEFQENLLTDELNKILLNNKENNKNITENIILYNQQNIALIRLQDLLATKISEISHLEEKLNKLSTDIRNNTRNIFYKEEELDSNKKTKIFSLFFYYNILIFYLIISNFISNKNYSKILPLFLVIIYILLPIIYPFLIIFLNYVYIYIKS